MQNIDGALRLLWSGLGDTVVSEEAASVPGDPSHRYRERVPVKTQPWSVDSEWELRRERPGNGRTWTSPGSSLVCLLWLEENLTKRSFPGSSSKCTDVREWKGDGHVQERRTGSVWLSPGGWRGSFVRGERGERCDSAVVRISLLRLPLLSGWQPSQSDSFRLNCCVKNRWGVT